MHSTRPVCSNDCGWGVAGHGVTVSNACACACSKDQACIDILMLRSKQFAQQSCHSQLSICVCTTKKLSQMTAAEELLKLLDWLQLRAATCQIPGHETLKWAAHRRKEWLRWLCMPGSDILICWPAGGSASMSKAACLLQLDRPPAWRLPAIHAGDKYIHGPVVVQKHSTC